MPVGIYWHKPYVFGLQSTRIIKINVFPLIGSDVVKKHVILIHFKIFNVKICILCAIEKPKSSNDIKNGVTRINLRLPYTQKLQLIL